MRYLTPLVIVLAVWPAVLAAGQNPPAKPAAQPPAPLSVEPVAGGLYFVKGGSGANTAFFVTKNEVIAIDAKMSAESAAGMLAEIRKVTAAPLTTIIITHSDGDHVNGLPGFPKGLRIIAHDKCRADIAAAAQTQTELKDYIPNRTYDKTLAIGAGAAKIVLSYFGPAHTSGDTVVLFPALKTVFVGDLLFVGRDPLIHRNKGGNSFGYVKTLDRILALKPRVETFLSGHANPLGRTDVETLRASMAGTQAKVKALVAEGKSLDEVKKAFGIEDRPGPGGRRWPSLVEVIYLELTEKK
jgi:glyoxylase-like metal-dependent hydrolase (beta-lactamase superfamily II)